MMQFIERRIVGPIKALLLEGITPQKIALSLACGIVLGVFPILGSTTLLCTLAVLALSLNLPATQLVNYFVYPLQLLLILPFIRAGEFLLRAPRTPLSLPQMLAIFNANHLQALRLLWVLALQGMLAWLVIAPFTFLLLYKIFLHSLIRLAAELQRRRSVRNTQGVA